jgi:hypothetical protein
MKTKISFFIAAVALVTLSFTFVKVDSPSTKIDMAPSPGTSVITPVGGIISDEVIK